MRILLAVSSFLICVHVNQELFAFAGDQGIALNQSPANESSTAKGSAGGGGIVYGGDIGIGAQAPAGWVFDSESARSQGIDAVMYPSGSTWKDATARMYISFALTEKNQSLADFIKSDIERFKKESPKLIAEIAPSLAVSGGEKAEVRVFSGDKWGNVEKVAYLKHGQYVVMFVFSCINQDIFMKNAHSFDDMVSNSFTATMHFEKKK
jgi:hypothetical protein